MTPLEKAAAFLFMIGLEKASGVMAVMDSDEIKKVLQEFDKLTGLSPKVQESVWREFTELGYQKDMNSVETLWVIRQLFGGSKISEAVKRRFSLL